MCGFVSVILNNSTVDEALLVAMRDNLVHRGPDAAGLWADGPVGFGQRRLSIIDLHAHSDQPFFSDDGRFVLNYNGEIYNYIELREELTAKGQSFRTQSDTEVLLKALMTWGEDALPRLNGMFAFTYWDTVEKTLLVARDRFGEKPLYYHADPAYGFAAASEMKALLADPRIPDDVDPRSVEAYQIGQYYEDTEPTFFAAIRRVLPAHFMRVNAKGEITQIKRYWTPDYEDIDHSMTQREAVDGFGARLEEAVRKRLRSDVTVGSSLSGGMDSSAIVAHIAKLRKDSASTAPQNTFSARFDSDPTMSEGPFIDSVVAHTGVTSHSVSPDPDKMLSELRHLHWHQEEPFLSASIYLQWCVARLARENDTTVLLDGQGADELLGGYQPYFRNHQMDMIDRGERLRSFVNTWRFNARMEKAAKGYKDASRRFNAKSALTLTEILALQIKRPAPYGMPRYEIGVPPMQPGFRARRQMAEALQYNTLPVLLRYADRNSMAFSREARLPFLDNDLVEFTLRIPDKWLFGDAWQKYPLRKSSVGKVPDEICWRADKVGYAAPLDLWIRGSLKDWAYERLFNGRATELAHFDKDGLQALWDAHQAGENHSWAFWKWISLNEWFDMQSEGQLRQPWST